jgi:transcriptional regulator with XRE-family HTH domain
MFSRIYATKSLSQPAQNLNIFSQVLAKGKLNINIATLIPNDLILELIFSIERSNLARTIKKYRKARKLTMEQLSEKSGINLSTLKKYETDNRNPKLEQLSKIAEALEVSVFEFLDIEVKSVNDIISLVNKMNIATDIDWDIDNDKVCISFKNKEINNCLKEYAVDYKKDNILIKKTETNYESTLTRLMLINDKLR